VLLYSDTLFVIGDRLMSSRQINCRRDKLLSSKHWWQISVVGLNHQYLF